MDSEGNEVYVYNPTNDSGITTRTTTYQLGENEELIGVYGVNEPPTDQLVKTYLSSFGFIVKVKQNG